MTRQFENRLPLPGTAVQVKTCWNKEWQMMAFQGQVSNLFPEKGAYDWFGVYSRPAPASGSLPIVTEWRYL